MRKSTVSVAEARRALSELLGRVAYGKETITITRRGRPMAILAPPRESKGLASVKGWLEDSDPFFKKIQAVVRGRRTHTIRPVRPSES